jgi:hypothetical protein
LFAGPGKFLPDQSSNLVEGQSHERHDTRDFDTGTQDKLMGEQA